MTAPQTITEDELIELLAAAEPNTLEVEDAMWAFVCADARHDTFEAKAMKMATLIAETARRRVAAQRRITKFANRVTRR